MKRLILNLLYIFIFLSFIALCAGVGLGIWGYRYVVRDLPDVNSINDYKPSAVTRVYSNDGTLIAEFFKERRYPVAFKDIPELVKHAFLSAEDASFYSHPGIDPYSILRAVVKNLRSGSTKQGASTITQQVVKNLLLTPERKFERKIKEAILSYRLERTLSKDDIFELYLNQIFLGNTAYGVKAAAKAYFNKDLSELDLAEVSILAGLPKAPSQFSPVLNIKGAKRRQRYVLDQMVRAHFTTREEADRAYEEKLKIYKATQQNIYAAPYFVGEIRRQFQDTFKQYDLDQDGLEVHTTVDLEATKLAEKSLKRGLRSVDKRRGWRGPLDKGVSREAYLLRYGKDLPEAIEDDEVYPAYIEQISQVKGTANILLGEARYEISIKEVGWLKKKIDLQDNAIFIKPEQEIKPGDVIEVAFVQKEIEQKQKLSSEKNTEKVKTTERVLQIDQTPMIEGSLALINPHSGAVGVMLGGYSYKKSVLNRVTQSMRQPGSTFKPIVYLAAIDGFKYSPATIVHDTPHTLKVGDQMWSPGNYDGKYLGDITLRVALERSRNMVSVDIMSRIGITPIIKYARQLGITTPIGKNPSIALGSSEVTLLELARAYGVFAAKGILADSYFIEQIKDRTGATIYDRASELTSHVRQVLNPSSAFIMAHTMKGVIDSGTATVIKPINRPVAGKTGTTNDMMDAWFIGYTPDWVCGIWTGFDQQRSIGNKETGGKVAAPIWLDFMKPFLDKQDEAQYQEIIAKTKDESQRLNIEYHSPEKIQPLDFQPTEDVVGMWINKSSGRPSAVGSPGSIFEYFLKGTEPQGESSMTEETQNYLDSPDM